MRILKILFAIAVTTFLPGKLFSADPVLFEKSSLNHGATINSTAWSPDGKYLAVGGDLYDSSVSHRIYKITNGVMTEVGSGYGAGSPVKELAWSPDGKFLAVCMPNGASTTQRVYSISDGVLTETGSAAHGNAARCLCWSPSGKHLVVGGGVTSGDSGTHRVYEVSSTGSLTVKSFYLHGAYVYSVQYSPDGNYLAIGGASGTNSKTHRIYAVDSDGYTLTEIGSYSHGATINSTAWSSDGKWFAIGGSPAAGPYRLRIYSITDGILTLTNSYAGPPNTLYCLQFSPDGKYLTTSNYRNDSITHQIYEVSATGTLTLKSSYDHGSPATYTYSISYSPDGKYIAIGGVAGTDSKTHRIYRVSTGALTLVDTESVGGSVSGGLAWSPDGKFLVAGSSRVSNLTTRMYKVSPNGFMNLVSSADHGAAVYSVDFSSDGKFVATGGSRYNSSVTHRVYSVADDGALTEVGSGYDYGNATVKAVAWSTDGKYLATCAHTDPGYRIYSAINGVLEEASYGGSWAGYGISWSPDGRYVAMCGYGQSVRVFSVSDGTLTEIGSGYTHGSYLYAVKWSPDGKYLAAGGISSGSITTRIYSASEGVLTQTATYDHTDRIYGLSWSPDSHFLAMSGENVSGVASVRIHRIQTGGTISSTVNYNPGVDNYECAWDPSGMLLVVGDTTNVRTLTWEDAQVKYTTDFGAEVRDVAWAGSESKFVAAGLGGYEGRAVAGYDFDSTTGVATLNDHLSSIKGGAEVAVFSPNGAYMFLSGYNGPRSKPYLHKIKHGNTLSRGIDLDYGNALRFGYNAVVNADGREIRFSNDNDPQLVLMDGVTGQIKNAVVRNFSTHKTSISSTATLVFGANSYVEFGADSTISDPIKFDGYVVLDGDGHTISFGDSGFSVTPTGTLHLKDAVLRNVVDKPFRCMGNNSTIIFDNVTIHLDGNLSFTKGLFNIKNQVDVTGTYTFDYSSTSTSRILEHSTLRIADDTMFKYSPIIAPTTDSEQLLFADTSSRMHLDGGTFWLNGCDILLRSGTLETSKHSYLKGGTSKNFKFGDGTEANNMNIDLGGTFEVLDNATVYWNNVDS